VPHSIKLQEEHGDDLAVLFVEVQGTPRAQADAFALGKEWLGTQALWTTESPFRLDVRGIPQFALLSPTGEVVLAGHNSALQSQLDDAIEDMVRSIGKGPEELPRKLARAWGTIGSGDYEDALEEAEELIEDGDDEAEVEGARRLVEVLNERVSSRIRRIGWMLDNGYPLDAEDQLEDLTKAVGERFGVAEDLAELEARLESDEFELEIEAAKRLARIERKLFEDPSEKQLGRLEDFHEDYAETRVGARALELLTITRLALQ